ncbi:hypothetical protein FRB99_006464 [Tulasnella sp. 403]|nr:hypothetical protein FRB99_006464 [Tulasnella sp. 403]
MASEGASNNERLLHAAKQDNADLIEEIFHVPSSFDINFADGLGNTGKRLFPEAAKQRHVDIETLLPSPPLCNGSVDVIDLILEQDNCDVDPINKLDKATPLHLAAKLEEEDVRHSIIQSLLDAGADMTIRDKRGSLAVDLLPGNDTVGRGLFRKAQAHNAIAQGDVADDSDGEPGSGSDED